MRVRFAFYKYNKKFINIGISVWTWLFNPFTPPLSHVEMAVFLEDGWQYFSSTTRGGAKGTRWIKPKELFKHPERWDVFEIEVYSIEDIKARADGILGCYYDFAGLSGFAMPFSLINSKKKWYCSEACYYILTGQWKKRISPRRFYSYLRKEYYPRRLPQ